jgi:hypothetical protein
MTYDSNRSFARRLFNARMAASFAIRDFATWARPWLGRLDEAVLWWLAYKVWTTPGCAGRGLAYYYQLCCMLDGEDGR